MTLHIDLPEEVEKRVVGAAAQCKLPVEKFVLALVDSNTRVHESAVTRPQDFGAYLKSLALFAGKSPNYPTDFWTREIVSGDHD